jgi:hypothetical protein
MLHAADSLLLSPVTYGEQDIALNQQGRMAGYPESGLR